MSRFRSWLQTMSSPKISIQNNSCINFKCLTISYVITFDILLTNIDKGGEKITLSWQFKLKCYLPKKVIYLQKHCICFIYTPITKPKLNLEKLYPKFVLCNLFFCWLLLFKSRAFQSFREQWCEKHELIKSNFENKLICLG